MRRAVEGIVVLVAAGVIVAGCGSAGEAWRKLPPSCTYKPEADIQNAASAVAYEMPSDPANPPGPQGWGWMPRVHALVVGQRLCIDKHLWRITAITPLPQDGKVIGIGGYSGPPPVISGRPIFKLIR